MSNILAKKIYQNERLVINGPSLSSINSGLITNTPVQVWLERNTYCCGGDEELQLTFVKPEDDINVIKGVYLVLGDDAFVIDGNIDDVNDKLNGCCGDDAIVTRNYPDGLPAIQEPVAKTYTVARLDDGTMGAGVDAELAYSSNPSELKNAIANSFVRVSRNNGTGVTTYSFQAYADPSPQGTDTITETALVFTSNTYATSLTGSNVYRATGVVDGVPYDVKAAGGVQTLAALITALNASVVTDPMGTWTAGTNQVILTTSTRDVATIVLGQVAP